MSKNLKNSALKIRLILLLGIMVFFSESTWAQDATITIHLRGVYQSQISLLTLSGSNTFKLSVNGDTITIYANSTQLDQTTDSDLSSAGTIRLLANSTDHTADFSNPVIQ